jgi:hypothetical protein
MTECETEYEQDLSSMSAYELGKWVGSIGVAANNPFDGRTKEGKEWKLGYMAGLGLVARAKEFADGEWANSSVVDEEVAAREEVAPPARPVVLRAACYKHWIFPGLARECEVAESAHHFAGSTIKLCPDCAQKALSF